MHSYIIPYHDQYIIYRPLLRLAFLGNAAMVNLISGIQDDHALKKTAVSQEAIGFLEQIGYFNDDPPAPPQPVYDTTFNPTTAILFLTDQCNFKCIYCYAFGGEFRNEKLPEAIGRKAISIVCQNALNSGRDHFLLGFHGGGEPTLAWHTLKKLVGFARTAALPCKIQLTTNGYWTQRQSQWIIDHIDEVSLSFDGYQSIQDRQRPLAKGKGTYGAVMQTIRRIDRHEKPYGIRMTVTEESIDELPQNIAFMCKETRCLTFQVEPAFKQGRAALTRTAVERNQRFAAAFMEAWEVAHAAGRHIYYSGARPWVITNRFCQAPDTALIVGPDGFLTTCYEICNRSHELAGRFIFGDLSEKSGITASSDIRHQLQKRVASRRERCRNCFCYWHCAGDCPSKTLTADDAGHLVFGERCELNRTLTRDIILHYIAAGNGVWQGTSEMSTKIC